MTWHVLLFGAATEGLRGVGRDLQRMQALVEASRLDGLVLTTYPEATRASFLAAFTGLIERVDPGDGVLVYYSGHGLRLRDTDTGALAYAIVPVGADGPEFGYVLQEELSAWFWRITAITTNVTWIADCCHATGVFRGSHPDLRPRGLKDRRQAFMDHRRRLLDELPAAALDPDGNPHVVRVCASASDKKAFEDPVDGGLLTHALAQALAEAEYRPLVCEDLARIVIRKLTRHRQLPTFAGPVRRWWLTASDAPSRTFPTAVLHERGTLLAGGTLLDQRPGDRYVVLDTDGAARSTLTITSVLAHRSNTQRDPDDDPPIVVGATAVLETAGEPRGTVALAPDDDPDGHLGAALTASGYLALAGASAAPLVARITRRDHTWHVTLPSGEPLGAWSSDAPEPLCALVTGLARQAALLALPCAAPELLKTKYRHTVPPGGGAVELSNLSERPIHVSAFALHPTGSIELVTRGQPDGEAIAPGRSLTIRPLRARPQRLVLIITDIRIDLRAWTSDTPRPPAPRRGDTSPWMGVHIVDV